MRIVLMIVSLVFIISCSNKKGNRDFFEHKGFSAGTNFIIQYDKSAGNINNEIDKLFLAIEQSISLSDSGSLLNRINRNDSTDIVDDHFIKLLNTSTRIYQETKGAFDPTMDPLIQFWGLDLSKFNNQSKIDSLHIDSLKNDVGLNKVSLEGNVLVKKNDELVIDFANIYQGYMVDALAELFKSYHIANYRIEVGGRIRANGLNPKGKAWQFGIDEPTDNVKTRKLLAIASLNNEAYAIAGSYRQYFNRMEMKLPFTIDPISGYPVKHTVISVTVFAPTCVEAEAYASAFMVMGLEPTKAFISNHPQLQVYMISTNYKGEWLIYISPGLNGKLEFVKETSI